MPTQPQQNTIKVANPDLADSPRTYLTKDYDAAVTSLVVLDKRGFFKGEHNDDTYFYILIGEYGDEKAEIKRVTSDTEALADNATLVVSATSYAHSASDPITYIPYNQIKFYGASSSGGSKNLLETISLDASRQYTTYIYEGSSYSYFYTAYYNSDNDEISAYSEEIENTDFGIRSAKRVIDSGLKKALTHADENPDGDVTWDVGIQILEDGIDEILARKRKWPFLHDVDTSISTVADTKYIAKPSDAVSIEFVSVDGRKLDFMTPYQYQGYIHAGTSPVPTGQPTNYTIREDLIYLYPVPDAVYTTEIDYYKSIAVITDLSTTLPRAFTTVLIYYCASQFAYIRNNDKRGDKMYKMFEKLLEQQVEEYSGPLQSGDAESIERTSVYGQDYFLEDIMGNV